MARIDYHIIVVDARNKTWRKSTAASLVRDLGLPLSVALEWGKIRRTMSPRA